MAREFTHVGVIGLGTMGAGIVEVFARNGIDVIAVEADAAALTRGRGVLDHSTGRAVQRGKLSAADSEALHARVTFTTDYDDLAGCQLVVEAVPEHLDLKKSILARVDKIVGDDTMPSTAENVAQEYQVTRDDQDAFALRSQQRTAAAQSNGRLAAEIVAVEIPQRKGEPLVVESDEHPRATSVESLARLKPIVRADGTVTAGNASGVNDGAAAIILASEEAARRNGLTPRARVLGAAVAGVPPRIMGIGPAPATAKLLKRLGLKIEQMDVIELNEAFAAQALAVLRQLGLPDDAPQVNPNGGAIALGHPLGMSGARLALTATEELRRGGGRLALATMCIGVGQGIALALERV